MAFFWLIPLIAFAIGLLPMPYGYYNLLRFVVTACAIVFAHKSFVRADLAFAWLFVAIAFLYNPFLPVHLNEKEIWVVINLITGVVFFIKRH